MIKQAVFSLLPLFPVNVLESLASSNPINFYITNTFFFLQPPPDTKSD